MKIDNIITDNDLINFLLDQHKQTLNPNFMVVAHTIERYRREIQMLQWQLSEREWISVEDRLPNKEGCYIVAEKDKYGKINIDMRSLIYWANGPSWSMSWQDRDVRGIKVAHWMPLPTPPTEKEN